MRNLRKTIFISDLHLDENNHEITKTFQTFVDGLDSSVDALYILGDLFEAWIGDDDDTPFHRQIIAALKSVSDRGIRLYFLAGNRDFLIGKRFARATQCQILQEETLINVYGTSVLLMHGDTLCTRDIAYLKSRKILRNKWGLCFFKSLPLFIRKKWADNMRMKSKKYTKTAMRDIMDVTPEAVIDVMQKHSVQFLIHGHTHKPAIHEISTNNKPAKRIVLDAWHGHGNMLVWANNQTIELVDF